MPDGIGNIGNPNLQTKFHTIENLQHEGSIEVQRNAKNYWTSDAPS